MPQLSHAPTYIIAEIANAHEGQLDRALGMVDTADDAVVKLPGVDPEIARINQEHTGTLPLR